jgi:hypothetical protein
MRCFVSGGKHRPNYFLKTSYTVPHANVKAAKKKKEKDSASQREQYAGRKGGGLNQTGGTAAAYAFRTLQKLSSFELHSQSMEERATLDRYHHFHGHSGMCA